MPITLQRRLRRRGPAPPASSRTRASPETGRDARRADGFAVIHRGLGLAGSHVEGLRPPPMGLTPIGFAAGFFAPMFTVLKVVGLDFFTVPAVLVMVYETAARRRTVAFLGAAFLAVPKENSGLAFAAVFGEARRRLLRRRLFSRALLRRGLGLGLTKHGLDRGLLGGGGRLLAEERDRGLGLRVARHTKGREGRVDGSGQPCREVARTNKKKQVDGFRSSSVIFCPAVSRPQRLVVSRRLRDRRDTPRDVAPRASTEVSVDGVPDASRARRDTRRGQGARRRGGAQCVASFRSRRAARRVSAVAARAAAICARARRVTHLGGRGDGGLRREHLGGGRHGGAEGQGRGHRVCVRTHATVCVATVKTAGFRRARARRAACLAVSLQSIGRRDPPRRSR